MRIMAGRLRRRKLLTNPGLTTRPISARVKGSLFEHLNPYLVDARVCDIYSGTGTMGLESLSRGAFSCVFIEQNLRAFELLNENVDNLGVREEVFVWRTDAVMTSYRPKYCEDLLPYEVVFFDPPYKMVEAMHPGTMFFKSLQRLAKDTITTSDVIVLFRTPRYAEFILPRCWRVERVLQYSTMTIHWLVKSTAEEAQENAELPTSEVIDETDLDEGDELEDDEDFDAPLEDDGEEEVEEDE